MKTVLEYIDDLKEKTGSDYKSAKLLNIDKGSLSVIRKKGQMADKTAIKVADLLGIDRSEVLIAADIARSTGEVKKAWGNVSKIAGLAAGVILATSLNIQAIAPFYGELQIPKMYIMLNYYRTSLF